MEDSKESRLRAEFEAWARRSGWVYLARRGDEGHYADSALEECWAGYRAASASRSEILEALRNLVVMLPPDAPERDETERIPAGFVYIRWRDLREARAALAKYQGE